MGSRITAFVGAAALSLMAASGPVAPITASSPPLRAVAAAASGWSPSHQLSSEAGRLFWPYENGPPAAALGPHAVAVAWAEWFDGEAYVMGAMRNAVGEWGPSAQITPRPVGDPDDIAVDAGPRGAFSVVWQQQGADIPVVYESHRSSGGWTEPVALGAGREPQVTIDGTGVTTVAWQQDGLHLVTRSDGDWSAPRTLGAGTPVRHVSLASNATGATVVAWVTLGTGLRAMLKPAGGSWLPPKRLTDRRSWGTQTAVAGSGRAIVVWNSGGSYNSKVLFARSSASGAWSETGVVARNLGEDGHLVGAAFNGAGHGAATWVTQWTTGDDPRTFVARFRPGKGWAEPHRVFRGIREEWVGPYPSVDRFQVIRLFEHDLMVRQAPGEAWSRPRVVMPNRAWVQSVAGNGWGVVLLYPSSREFWARVFTT